MLTYDSSKMEKKYIFLKPRKKTELNKMRKGVAHIDKDFSITAEKHIM